MSYRDLVALLLNKYKKWYGLHFASLTRAKHKDNLHSQSFILIP